MCSEIPRPSQFSQNIKSGCVLGFYSVFFEARKIILPYKCLSTLRKRKKPIKQAKITPHGNLQGNICFWILFILLCKRLHWCVANHRELVLRARIPSPEYSVARIKNFFRAQPAVCAENTLNGGCDRPPIGRSPGGDEV